MEPAPATTTVDPWAAVVGLKLGLDVGLMVLSAPVVTVVGDTLVVTVCVLASTHPTSRHE